MKRSRALRSGRPRDARAGIALLGAAAVAAIVVPRAIARRRRIDLAGRVALVTGASRGLGLLVAEELGRQGARVALLARDERELAAAASRLEAQGIEASTIRADVRDRDDGERAVAQTVARFGRLDVLVNNAGVITVAPLEATKLEDFEEALATHFWGPLYLIRAALPYLPENGRIVNVSSIGGKIAVPHLSAYSASKFALVGLSDAVRSELAPRGIRVTTVCPGLMRTGSFVHARLAGDRQREFAWFAVSSSLPVVTAPARRMARRIVAAMRAGRPDLTSNVWAAAAAALQGAMPNVTARVNAGAARFLPAMPQGRDGGPSPAWRHTGRWAPSWLTSLGDRAAGEHHELLGEASAYRVARDRLREPDRAGAAQTPSTLPARETALP